MEGTGERSIEIRKAGTTAVVTAESIARTVASLKLLQGAIPSVLRKGVDYGHIPGIPGEMLKDSGASNIINFFNAYPGDRRILHLRDDGETIAVCVEVQLISRESGMPIATGVAASSTQELKHKYRWVDNPIDWGYDEDAVKNWPKRNIEFKDGVTKYKIRNPEHSELLDIVMRQASKRAEADAARTLPGVGTALSMLLEGKIEKPQREEQDWNKFWGEVNLLGIPSDEVHVKLRVKSLKDWLATGKTLEQALEALREAGDAPKPPSAPISPKKSKQAPTKESLKTLNDLYKVCNEDFSMQPEDVIKDLGYTRQIDITETPWEAYQIIRGIRGGKDER
jgi:hypothetical protein